MNMKKTNWLKPVIAAILLAFLAFPVFSNNALGTAPTKDFEEWQLDSSSLVLASVQVHLTGGNESQYGLYRLQPEKLHSLELDGLSIEDLNKQQFSSIPYVSSLGFQGIMAQGVADAGFWHLKDLRLINAALFSVVFSTFIVLMSKITNVFFGATLGLVAVSSPWIVVAARNPYWVLWTWYLPLIFLVGFYLSRDKLWRLAFASFAFISFVLRFGAGYEFLTSLALFGAVIPLLAKSLSSNWPHKWRKTLRESLFGFLISISAFLFTLSIHSFYRGDGNLLQGLINIYNEDVVRRTSGFAGEPESSASIFEMLKRYLFEWRTDFLSIGYQAPFDFEFGSTSPWALLALSTCILIFMWIKNIGSWLNLLTLLLSGILVSMSWYVMAKAHSFYHPHINFVLWYLLLAPALIYIPIFGTFEILRNRKRIFHPIN